MTIIPMLKVSDIISLWSNIFDTISVFHFNRHLHFFMTMHAVRTYHNTECIANCYFTVLKQFKSIFKFFYFYVISIEMS
jgi:hypothetical protein